MTDPLEPRSTSATEVREADTEARTAILESTYRLLEDQGYLKLTTDDIALAARVSKATIYRLWRSKQLLVVEAARRHLGPVQAPNLGSFRAEIHWILEQRMRDYRDPRTLRLVAEFVGAGVGDPLLGGLFAEWVDHLSSAIRQAVDRGIERGDVRTDIDVAAIENLVAGTVSRAVILQRAFTPDVVDSMVELIATAAKPQP